MLQSCYMETLEKKPALFDIDTREFNPYWVDPAQPLLIPKNPLHFHAHKLQILLERMDKQLEKNPAQFNSATYMNALKKFTEIVEGINNGKTSIDEILDNGGVAPTALDDGTTPEMGPGIASSVDSGVSSDNPLAG